MSKKTMSELEDKFDPSEWTSKELLKHIYRQVNDLSIKIDQNQQITEKRAQEHNQAVRQEIHQIEKIWNERLESQHEKLITVSSDLASNKTRLELLAQDMVSVKTRLDESDKKGSRHIAFMGIFMTVINMIISYLVKSN